MIKQGKRYFYIRIPGTGGKNAQKKANCIITDRFPDMRRQRIRRIINRRRGGKEKESDPDAEEGYDNRRQDEETKTEE